MDNIYKQINKAFDELMERGEYGTSNLFRSLLSDFLAIDSFSTSIIPDATTVAIFASITGGQFLGMAAATGVLVLAPIASITAVAVAAAAATFMVTGARYLKV